MTALPPRPYLITIAIGPVQDFIAAGRKVRDLWYGSELLSLAARETAQQLLNLSPDGSLNLIFPPQPAAGEDLPTDAPVANLIVARLKHDNPDQLIKQVHNAVKAWLTRQLDDALVKFRETGDPLETAGDAKIDVVTAHAQVDNFLEWFAAWYPIAPDDSDYHDARVHLMRLLAGRKSHRNFAQEPSIAGRQRSSLDPARDNVLNHALLSRRDRRRLRLKRDEPMDGVSVLKRMGGMNRIASVSRVAADPWIRHIAQHDPDGLAELNQLARALQCTEVVESIDTSKYIPHYTDFPWDTELLFVEDLVLDRQNDLSDEELKLVNTFIKTVTCISKRTGAEPCPYMVTIAADGDKVGEALSSLISIEHHQQMSHQLVAFAEEASEITARHHGVFIYGGGDDVFAFLPLDTSIACAEELRTTFASDMKRLMCGLGKTIEPTLSVGLSIGHFHEHLDSLTNRARDAESEAKRYPTPEHPEKNALAVTFTARSSGKPLIVTDSREAEPVQKRWLPAIAAIDSGAISQGAYRDIAIITRELQLDALVAALKKAKASNTAEAPPWTKQVTVEVLRAELAELLKRKKTRDAAERSAEMMLTLLGNEDGFASDDIDAVYRAIRRVIDRLHIVSRMATARYDTPPMTPQPEEGASA